MIKIVSGPQDTKGFNVDDLYRVFEVTDPDWVKVADLAALASSESEAHDALEMLFDLTGKKYHISPPRKLAN
jgi:hypothetical protein